MHMKSRRPRFIKLGAATTAGTDTDVLEQTGSKQKYITKAQII